MKLVYKSSDIECRRASYSISTFAICRKMESIDLVSKATVDDLIFQKFESPLPKSQDDDDPFIRGEFDVIKELLEKFPAAVEGKKKIDRVIDVCGPTPKGELSLKFIFKAAVPMA